MANTRANFERAIALDPVMDRGSQGDTFQVNSTILMLWRLPSEQLTQGMTFLTKRHPGGFFDIGWLQLT